MAQFCVDCFNKLLGEDVKPYDFVLEYGLCEECGKEKMVIDRSRAPFSPFYLYRLIEYNIKQKKKERADEK